MINQNPSLVHWNYFLALENDVDILSRYIEFDSKNFSVFSIELAHLLLASCSEVDVIFKALCKLLSPAKKPKRIDQYRSIIKPGIDDFENETVKIARFGLELKPWANWESVGSPLWWKSYNNVKHERNHYFKDANLENVLNAMSGLLVVIYHFYKIQFGLEKNLIFNDKQTFAHLNPNTKLFHLDKPVYYTLRVG